MSRTDFAFPFAIDAASGQAQQASYSDHVDQMIRQVLLTDPGERINLPGFGAGLRRLLFASMTNALQASTQMAVTQALNLYLGNQINVKNVLVATAGSTVASDGSTISVALPDGAILIQVTYQLLETLATAQTQVVVG